ncbi:hypothetical protein AB0A63_19255 [Lentzea sp. NPDC042327]|uniref:hypothetical protein n=1 Tax=Lentzea sp. NPDC042327 TaxID=3154801 RepID=UPI0033DF8AF7
MKKALLGLGFAVAALLGTTGAAQASTPDTWTVEAWHDAVIRDCEHLACTPVGVIRAGETHVAYCWEYGQYVRDLGYSNNVWIMVSMMDGGRYLTPAIYLKGDIRANIPYEDDCVG